MSKSLDRARAALHSSNDASPDEIQAYYNRLRDMDRRELEKKAGGRLDPSHLRSESKATLINAALNERFSRKDLDAWGK